MNSFLYQITPSCLPAGATFFSDFMSLGEEHCIAVQLDRAEWSVEIRRRVQHFGYRYDYKARAVAATDDLSVLSEWLEALTARLVARGCFESVPDQVVANEYLPGQGMSAHVEYVPCFDDAVVSVSVLCQCEMVFRQRRSNAALSAVLRSRSAIVLTGAGHYDWTPRNSSSEIRYRRRYESGERA